MKVNILNIYVIIIKLVVLNLKSKHTKHSVFEHFNKRLFDHHNLWSSSGAGATGGYVIRITICDVVLVYVYVNLFI